MNNNLDADHVPPATDADPPEDPNALAWEEALLGNDVY